MAASRRTIIAAGTGAAALGLAAYAFRGKTSSGSALWASYKARFLKPEGRIADTGNGGVSHSEGQGYGMIFAAAHNDRATFDALWAWTQKTLMRPDGLFSWKFVPDTTPDASIPDRNNASDGDILICWALARAGAQWNDSALTDAAKRIAASVKQHVFLTEDGQTYLLPGVEGFKSGDSRVVNLSYWVFPALRAIQELTNDAAWQNLIDSGLALIAKAQFGPHRLPPDWLETAGGLRPAGKFPARFGYDAIRVPLNLAWGRAPAATLQPFADFWMSLPATDAYPAWVDVTTGEQSADRQSRGMRAVADLALHLGGRTVKGRAVKNPIVPTDLLPTDDYYAASLILQTDLAVKEQSVS